MSPPYRCRFRARHYELDALGRVGPVMLVRWLQEAAIEGSTALGLSPDWYRQQGTAWVVRRLWVRYRASLGYGDEVEVTTWVSAMRGVRSFREYVLHRLVDDQAIAQARVEWIYVDTRTGQPTRCPDDWSAALPAAVPLDQCLSAGLGPDYATVSTGRHAACRRVQFHELDVGRHVNHAVYLDWAEAAALEVLRQVGHPPPLDEAAEWHVVPEVHEMQYSAAAMAGDEVEITSWVSERDTDHLVWTHEVAQAGTGRLLARDLCRWSFRDGHDVPVPVPKALIAAVLGGA